MQVNRFYFSILLSFFVLVTSCSKDIVETQEIETADEPTQNNEDITIDGGWGSSPMPSSTFIRFVSSTGTNVLDSLNILEKDSNRYLSKTDTIISLEAIRTSTGKLLYDYSGRVQNYLMWNIKNENNESYYTIDISDFDIYKLCLNDFIYDDSYEFTLKSDKLFGKGVTHTIKWYYHITTEDYSAYKCEVDGVEHNLKDDYIYSQTAGVVVGAYCIITIPIKE